VNGNEHHFRVIQFPLNLIEHDALRSTAGQPSLIDHAKVFHFDTCHFQLTYTFQQAKLVTLSNRPLNALVDGQLSRLVLPDIQPSGKLP